MTAWFLVDAFAEQPFTGNPAAVVMLGAPTDRTWMQATAAELHQPTSAFVWPEAGAWGIRWFTPSRELPLCGHATLAAAHVLDQDEIVFRHRDGTLTARRRDQLIWLGFPAVPVTQGQAPEPRSTRSASPQPPDSRATTTNMSSRSTPRRRWRRCGRTSRRSSACPSAA